MEAENQAAVLESRNAKFTSYHLELKQPLVTKHRGPDTMLCMSQLLHVSNGSAICYTYEGTYKRSQAIN